MIFLLIIVAIVMFSFIIIIHEFGHFSAARKFGVQVEEFGLGIPPKAKKLFTDKKGTVFTLNWLPLGGFVRLKGENDSSPLQRGARGGDSLQRGPKGGDSLQNANYFAHSIILLGGVFMNFLLAIIIFSTLFFIGVKPVTINEKIATNLESKIMPTKQQALQSGILQQGEGVLLHPVKDSIAEKTGIKQGDILIQINKKIIGETNQAIKIISQNANKELILHIKREEKIINIPIIPLPLGETRSGLIGSYISENITFNTNFEYKYGLLDSLKYGTIETYTQSLLTLKGLGILMQKIINPKTPEERTQAVKNMKGPIGIIDVVVRLFDQGITIIIIIGALISISLGVFNLLPIPALDGGRFLFLTINTLIKKITGKSKVNTNIETSIHIFFFLILIALSLIIGYNDISNILDR